MYASYFQDDDYWLLRKQWSSVHPPFTLHQELGWIGDFDAETYRHTLEKEQKGRIPILLFGDSFSACVDEVLCFEDILDEHPTMSKDYYILNYGVGGYGIDQILMLMKRVVPLYPDAIVIAGFMTLDIDRAHLRYRDANKPKMDVHNKTLVLTHTPKDDVKLNISSYLYRKMLFSHFTPTKVRSYLHNEARARQKKIERLYYILDEMNQILKQHSGFFVVFDPLLDSPSDWRAQKVESWMRKKQAIHLLTREIYDKRNTGERSAFIRSDGHPTEYYNRKIAENINLFVDRITK